MIYMTRFNNTLKDWASSIWTFYVYIFSFFKCNSFKQCSAHSFLIILTMIHLWLNFIISSGYYISPINCFKKRKSIGSLNLFERFLIWFHILNRFINSAWKVDLKGVIQLNGLWIEISCSIRDIHGLKGWRVGLRNENKWQARIHCFDGFYLQSDSI